VIRQSLYFKFNGESSEDYNLWNINMSTGMQSEPFASPRNIKEVSIRGTSRRYFQEIQLEPLEFTVSFAFKTGFTSDDLRSVARWLTTPNFYAPLQFFDGTNNDLNQIYYAMFIDSPELFSSSNQGYINLKVRCYDAYAYSGIYTSEIYDYSANVGNGTSYVFENKGDVDVQPVIIVEIVSGNLLTIQNNSAGGQKLQFNNLQIGETVIIDCENEIIETNLANTYRYDNMASDSTFLSIPRGFNYMNIKGNVKIQWKFENKYIVG
jgi:phage-related protein